MPGEGKLSLDKNVRVIKTDYILFLKMCFRCTISRNVLQYLGLRIIIPNMKSSFMVSSSYFLIFFINKYISSFLF